MVDFEKCLKITPTDEIVLSEEDNRKEISIDGSECIGKDKTMEVKVTLCKGQIICGGGTADNRGIEVESERELILNFKENKKTINARLIEESFQGLYGIPVGVEIGKYYTNDDYKIVLVEVSPEKNAAFALKRYEYYFTGNEQDTVTLSNSLFEEKVKVWSSECDWAKQ